MPDTDPRGYDAADQQQVRLSVRVPCGVAPQIPTPRTGRPVRGAAQAAIREVIEEKGAWLVEFDVVPDHVHLLVEVDPC